MARFRTPAAVAAVLVSAGVAVAHAAPEWTAAAGLDFWNLPGLEAERRAAYAEYEKLEDRHQVLQDMAQANDRVAGALVEGRFSLAEALAEFGGINRARPGFYEVLGMYAPDGTDNRELLGVFAQRKARTLLRGDPSRSAEVMSRLTDEYRAMFHHDPAPPPAAFGGRYGAAGSPAGARVWA
jgi:hypothetical protein